MRESDTPDVYSNVYNSERPEVFFKASSERCVGPFEFRSASEATPTGTSPNPNWHSFLYRGDIVGYTIGNDHEQPHHRRREPAVPPAGEGVRQVLLYRPVFRDRRGHQPNRP